MKPWKEIMDETMWCWKRLLRVPWTTRKSNQSTRKKINAEYSLEGLMLKLKCQYFDYLLWRAYSLEKTLILGKIEGRRWRDDRGWDGWMVSPTQWTWVWANYRRQWRTGKPGMLQSMGSQRVRHKWDWTSPPLSNSVTEVASAFKPLMWTHWSFHLPVVYSPLFQQEEWDLI